MRNQYQPGSPVVDMITIRIVKLSSGDVCVLCDEVQKNYAIPIGKNEASVRSSINRVVDLSLERCFNGEKVEPDA